MFVKPYKLKSTNTLKNSEKKHLIQRICNEFASATDTKAKEIIPLKSNINCMKLILHSQEVVNVYVVDAVPMLIEMNNCLMPTVFGLWRVPDLLPTLVMHASILSKIVGGAPLYAPGLCSVQESGGVWPRFLTNHTVAVATNDNLSAVIVGTAKMASDEMLLAPRGVCVEAIHVYGDQLCRDPKFSKVERPFVEPLRRLPPAQPPPPSPPPAQSSPVGDDADVADDFEDLDLEFDPDGDWPELVLKEAKSSRHSGFTPPTTLINDKCSEGLGIPEDMDGLLRWCLLCVICLEDPQLQLPLPTNLLYKNYMMKYCPKGRILDVKKSSHKKLSKFLEAMQAEGLVEVREKERGVWAVTATHRLHPAARALCAPPSLFGPNTPFIAPATTVIIEVLCVTAAVAKLFPNNKKGDPVTKKVVCDAVTEYVTARGLRLPGSDLLRVDALLAQATGLPLNEGAGWADVVGGVCAHMTPGARLMLADGSWRLLKHQLQPVRMKLVRRTGNKKVTVVSNLQQFQLSLEEMAGTARREVGAACAVGRPPGAAAPCLLLQGDQTRYVAKVLLERHHIPKKYIEGADKALSKKK